MEKSRRSIKSYEKIIRASFSIKVWVKVYLIWLVTVTERIKKIRNYDIFEYQAAIVDNKLRLIIAGINSIIIHNYFPSKLNHDNSLYIF